MTVYLTKHKETTFNEAMSDSASPPTVPASSWYHRMGPGLVAALAPLAALLVLRFLLGVASRSWPVAGPSAAPATVDDVMLGMLSWAAVALCAWLSIIITLSAAAALPGRVGQAFETLAQRVTPAVVRRSVAMVLGVSVSTLALPAGPASGGNREAGAIAASAPFAAREAATVAREAVADSPSLRATTATTTMPSPVSPVSPAWRPSGHDDTSSGPKPGAIEQAGPGLRATGASPSPAASRGDGPGWRPTPPLRVLAEQPTLLTPALRADSASMDHVTVRRGDSLWSIAARHLGPSATDAEIAHEWPRWYAANAALIGDDPDLIYPGQQLLPPHRKVLR